MERGRKKRRQERRRLRKLKMRTLLMLSITLIFNAYAWFLYVTTVSTNMTVHVRSWSVNFSVDDDAVTKEILFNVEDAYPGMETVSRTVRVSNTGEKTANVEYIVKMARILNTTYIVRDQLEAEDIENLTGDEIEKTAEELTEMLENDYPFKVTLSCGKSQLVTGQYTNVSFSFKWDYEGDDTNDEIDTQFGVGAYEYYNSEEGSGLPAMQIRVKLMVTQSTD